ncbi:DUF354 domain-containing protein [soil metagenome]
MRIWIDLANSPHVPFFRPLVKEFQDRGHEVEVTARDFAETVDLAQAAGFTPEVISGHGGRELTGKAGNLVRRAGALRGWAHSRAFALAVSHNSYSQILAAKALSLRSVTLMDYEHQPANHLAFRFAARIIVPRAFPDTALAHYGAHCAKVKRYNGIKEDVYLADFEPDQSFKDQLGYLGIRREDVLVVVRPPARDALYHRFENELFEELLGRLSAHPGAKVIFLARNASQRATYSKRASAKLILPEHTLDGPNLIASSDLVVSGGGTMNREAAALGVPAATIFAGEWAAVDEQLVRERRLRRILTHEDLVNLPIEKKAQAQPRSALHVRAEVADLILEDLEPAKRGASI